jgi:hypothetical protein
VLEVSDLQPRLQAGRARWRLMARLRRGVHGALPSHSTGGHHRPPGAGR